MGIREYFKEQLSEDDSKMQDFNMEKGEVEDKLVFDPEEELSEKDWRHFDDYFEYKFSRMLEDKDYIDLELPHWLVDVADYKIISSKRFEKFMEDKRDLVWKLGKECLLESLDNIYRFVELASGLHQLFPDRFNELDFAIHRTVGMVSAKFLHYKRKYDYENCKLVANFKIAFPDYFDQIELSIRKKMEQVMAETSLIEWDSTLESLSYRLRYVRILFPERDDELEFGGEKLEEMKEWLAQMEQGKWRMAASMKILAADKVEVTDRGLKIVMPEKEDFKQVEKKKPVRRSF